MDVNLIQSQDISHKPTVKLTQIACTLLLSILLACCEIQPAKTVTTPTSLRPTSPAATLDSKVVLEDNLNQVLGKDQNNFLRLTKISYSDPEAGDITITWAIHDNADPDLAKINAQRDAATILQALETSKTRFIYVILIGTVSRQDQQGKPVDMPALRLDFNKSKLDKVNWEAFQPEDIVDLADIAEVAEEWK